MAGRGDKPLPAIGASGPGDPVTLEGRPEIGEPVVWPDSPWWRALVWGLAGGLSLLFAWRTRFGPAIEILPTHGVHVGDLVAFTVNMIWARALTRVSAPPPPQR